MGACFRKSRSIKVNSKIFESKSLTKKDIVNPQNQNKNSQNNLSNNNSKNNLHIVQKPSNFLIIRDNKKEEENDAFNNNNLCLKNKTWLSSFSPKRQPIDLKECRNSTVIFVGHKNTNSNANGTISNSTNCQLTNTNHFNKLSQKVLYCIFDYFNFRELEILGKVSKIFHNIVRNPNILKKFCIKSPEKSVTLPIQITYYSNNFNQQINNLQYNLVPNFNGRKLKANIEIHNCVNPNTSFTDSGNQTKEINNSLRSMQSTVVYIDPFTSKNIEFDSLIKIRKLYNSFDPRHSQTDISNDNKTPTFSDASKSFEANESIIMNKNKDEDIPNIVKKCLKKEIKIEKRE